MTALATAFVRLRYDTSGSRRDAERQVDRDMRSVGNRAGRSFGASFDKGIGRGGAFATVLAVTAARATLLGAASASAAPAVLKLAGALAPAAGAAVAFPAALTGAIAAVSTFKLAVAGVGDAIKAGFGDDAEKAAEALAKLSPEARHFARQVIGVKGQLNSLQDSTADAFFRRFNEQIEPLARTWLPTLNRQLPILAGAMGGVADEFAVAARQQSLLRGVQSVLGNSATAAKAFEQAVRPAVGAFGRLLTVGAPTIREIGIGLSNATIRMSAFITEAAKSGRLAAALEEGKRTLADLGGILGNVGSIFGSVFRAANAGGNTLLGTFRDLTGQAAGFLRSAQGMSSLTSLFTTLGQIGAGIRTALAGVLPQLGEAIKAIGPAIGQVAGPAAQLVVALSPLLPFAAGLAATVLKALTPAIAVLAGFLARNETLVKALAVAFGVWLAVAKTVAVVMAVQAVGGLKAWIASTKVAVVLTKVWAGVQAAFNAIMAANPIGLAVVAIAALVAAVVIAYKKSDTFRAIVQAAWQGIRTAVTVAWNNYLKPALTALAGFLRDTLGPVVMGFYNRIIKPAWAGISLAVRNAWIIIKVILAAFRLYLNAYLIPIIRFLWNNVVRPIFTQVGNHIRSVWNNLIRPSFAQIRAAFNLVASSLRGTWNGVIKPVFTAIGNFIRDNLVMAFRLGVKNIRAAWAMVKEAAAEPIRFVVNTVINRGVIGTFNRVAGFLGVKDRIDPLRVGFAAGGHFNGRLPGAPSSRDNMVASSPMGNVALASGEYIVNARQTARNLPLLEAINSGRGFADGGLFGFLKGPANWVKENVAGGLNALRSRFGGTVLGRIAGGLGVKVRDMLVDKAKSMLGGLGGFFRRIGGGWPSGPAAQRGDSGVWRSIVALIRSTGPVSGAFGNAYRHGDPLWHGSGRAVDWMGYNQDALATFLAARKPLELIHRTNTRDYAYTRGQNMGSFDQALMEAHRNHIHVAFAKGGLLGRLPFGSYDSGGYLPTGLSIAHNGTGRPERVGGGDMHVHLHNHGVIGSQRELDLWLAGSVKRLQKERKL